MAKLVKMNGTEKPDIMTIEWSSENRPVYAAINANITSSNDENGEVYYWDALVLPDYTLSNIHNADKDMKYKVLTIHILRSYYDDNDATAVLSNYISNPDNEKYKKEFDELQNCRKLAKTLANNIIENNIF